MPSQKTLAESYWQYTRQREEQALNHAKEAMYSARIKDYYTTEYQLNADFYFRRAERLHRLCAKIVGRMMR